ncbi:hypothetical protein DRE_00147 [Drechslerella stenobrocha 248]|uniref:Uncharacterized protein n=1 Tax=Drechslerella stenobrocha 248 TaxID=1043628 RepID=W7I9R3_9PEZI|nr:hypothetical protein DRE_00147 [Drechslerella stenobrocha 248]
MSSPTVLSYILPTNPLKRLYYRWKTLRLPWRKRYFVGMDLAGNTFWEFRDRITATRPRRIMDFRGGRHTMKNYQEMVVDPQWHQWLRATRLDPPSIAELQADVTRRRVMLERARLADERWAQGGSRLSRPGSDEVARLKASAEKTALSGGPGVVSTSAVRGDTGRLQGSSSGKDTTVQEMEQRLRAEREKREAIEEGHGAKGWPSGPSEEFQPEAWTPRARDAR